MEESALPLVHASRPPPSTLAPPPLETATTGTRSLQRFDLGRMRAATAPSPSPSADSEPDSDGDASDASDDEIAIIVATMKIAVPARIKELPLPAPTTISRTAPWPRFDLQPKRWARPIRSADASGPLAIVRDVTWALAAAASLSIAASATSALVYALVFP